MNNRCKNQCTNPVQTHRFLKPTGGRYGHVGSLGNEIGVKLTWLLFWYTKKYMVRTLLCVVLFFILTPIAYAGDDLGNWIVTRYYTPVPGQEHYYNGWSKNEGVCKISNLYYIGHGAKRMGDYTAEMCMQGSGDIFKTADGTDLHYAVPFSVGACSKQYLGKTIFVSEIGYVKCADTGGGVHGNHVDVWAGIGEEGYENINTAPGGLLHVYLKKS